MARQKKREATQVANQQRTDRDYTVRALDQGMRVLLALGVPEYCELSIDELKDALGIGRDTVRRCLITLRGHQLVEEYEGKWRVAPGMSRFSDGFKRMIVRKKEDIGITEVDHLGYKEI